MDKPIEEMSFDEIEAERRKIAAERAALARDLAYNTKSDTMRELYEGIAEDAIADEVSPIFASPAAGYTVPAGHEFIETNGLPTTADLINGGPEESTPEEKKPEEKKPEPWPHQHMVHCGLELDVRIPNQSALMAISMLQQLNGMGQMQMEIFNTFLANHLSVESLGRVIGELTRPESEMTIQSLIQALVDMRIAEGNTD